MTENRGLNEWVDDDGFPMEWSFGPLGDLVWLFVPSFRLSMIELALARMQFDLVADDDLSRILPVFLLNELSSEIGMPAMGSQDDVVRRREFLTFLRRGLTFRGQEAATVKYELNAFVLEWLMLPPYRGLLRQYDPELEEYIVDHYGATW